MAAPVPINVALVDDHQLVLTGLARALGSADGLRLTGAFSSTGAALAALNLDQPHVLLLDLDMPGSDTIAFLSSAALRSPGTRVVMFSGYCDAREIDAAIAAGARGYILKDESIPTILDMVRRAAAGEFVISDLALEVLGRFGPAPEPFGA